MSTTTLTLTGTPGAPSTFVAKTVAPVVVVRPRSLKALFPPSNVDPAVRRYLDIIARGTNLWIGDGLEVGATSGKLEASSHTHTESDISDLGTTVAMVADNLSVFATTTSAQLAGVISDETGSGALAFATSPTLVTPILGTPTSGTLTNCTGPTSMITSGTFADALISESSVTQHKAAIHADIGWLKLATPTELTISSGVVTATQSYHQIDTEGDAATDDLDTINGGSAGRMLFLGPQNGTRDVVLKDGTGNIFTQDGADITLSLFGQRVLLLHNGTNWYVVSGP